MSTYSTTVPSLSEAEQARRRQKIHGRILAVLALLLLTFAVQFSLLGFDDWFMVGLNMIELTTTPLAAPDSLLNPALPTVDASTIFTLGWQISELLETMAQIIKQIFSLLF